MTKMLVKTPRCIITTQKPTGHTDSAEPCFALVFLLFWKMPVEIPDVRKCSQVWRSKFVRMPLRFNTPLRALRCCLHYVLRTFVCFWFLEIFIWRCATVQAGVAPDVYSHINRKGILIIVACIHYWKMTSSHQLSHRVRGGNNLSYRCRSARWVLQYWVSYGVSIFDCVAYNKQLFVVLYWGKIFSN